MDFNATIDIILKDLREVREIIDDLKNYPGIPGLQVELAKSKCKSAEEVIALLKTLKPTAAENNDQRKAMADSVKKVEAKAADTEISQPREISERVKKPPEKLIEISDDKEDEAIIVREQPSLKDKKTESTIVADKFAGKPNTVSDQFGSSKKDDDIASVIKTKYVENLSDAIGINDKFLFIREIFAGSQPAYEEAISRLNRVETFADAKAIVTSFPGGGEENEVVKQFLEIVKRKLPSDG